MSLENKGNVVIDLKNKYGLKEDDKKKIIENDVTEKNLDSFSFDKFDEAIEKSFQNFLKTITINSHDSKETIQMQFNNWLDDKCKELDIMKGTEIDEKIIKPVSFELVKEATRTELEDLQKELLEAEKKKTEASVDITVNEGELKGLTKLYNGVTKQEVVNLLGKDFDGRKHLLDLLKVKNSDNIKKLQRIIAGISEDDGSKDHAPETNAKLGGTGVDGMFGRHTLETFEQYVKEKSNVVSKATATAPADQEQNNEVGNPAPVDQNGNNEADNSVFVTSDGREVQAQEHPQIITNEGQKGSRSTSEKISDFEKMETIDEDTARKIVDQQAGKEAINLNSLRKLSKGVATILAEFEGELYLRGLEEVDEGVLNEFAEGNCTKVHVSGGTLEKGDDETSFIINGKTYEGITNNVYKLLGIRVKNAGSGTVGGTGPAFGGTTSSSSTQTTTTQQGKGTATTGNKTGGNTKQPASKEALHEKGGMAMGEYVSLSTLTPEQKKQLEKNKFDYWYNATLDCLINLDRGIMDATEAMNYIGIYGASATITYGNQEMGIRDFFTKIENKQINYNSLKVAGVTYDDLVYEYTTNGKVQYIPILKNISFSTKTESDNTETSGAQLETDAGNMLDLRGIEGIEVSRAVQRADHEGSINLTGLKKLNTDVLHAFMNGKCKRVYFPGGILIKDNGAPYILIDGKKYAEVTKDVCKDLLKSREGVINIVNGNGNETGADVQQQYEGIGYNIDNPEATRQASTGEEAIQFLTKGSGRGVFFIARLFGKKKHNTELSIVDANYEPTGQEKTDLNNLNKYLLECKDNPTEVFTKIFRQNKDFGDNESLGKLYDLYRECRNDQNGTKKGAYLKKVMGLLENYFVRGRKGKDGKIITTFKDMYNNELLGIRQDLEKKDKEAAKKLSEDEKAQLKETGGTTTEAVNTKTRIAESSEKFADFREKYGFDSNAETQFAMCLCDLNADGRIDSIDMNAKTGQELFNIIRDAKVDQRSGILEKGPMYNILNFAKIKAEQDGHANTAEFLKGINLNGTDEEIMDKIKTRPLTVQYLRYMLINSPMNMANNIIRYGGVRVDTENTGDDLLLDKETREAINKIMSDEKFEEIYGNAYQQLIEQGLNDNPEIKKKLRPIIALALFESSGSYMGGISGGFDLSLGNAGDIAFMLGVGYGPDGNIMAGVNVAYGKSRALGKRKGSIISVGVSGGVNFAEGQFVPMVIGSAGFSQMINGPKLEKTLEARSAKFLGVDGNVGVIGGIPVWGVGLSYSQDTMKGLNTTYESIKSGLGNVLKETLKDSWPNSTDKTEIRTQMIASIKTALESRYGRTNEDELNKAAQNIFGGISYYLTEIENPSQITQEQKTAIIEKVAENYANQRRNKEMQNLNGKTTFESARVGLEFLVGFWPIPMASVSFKRYGNLTANETVESMENYYQRLSSGIGMEYIDNSVSTEGNDKGYLTAASITYLNNKLSVLSPSGDVPPIKKIINGDKYDLQIPRNLCKYANISYNPELENYMKYDESSDSFMVPANIKMGLLTYSRTNDGKYNLILGDFKKGDGFKDLDINSKPEGDTTKYDGKEGELQITESVINGNEEMKKLFENPEFPLSECVESKDGKVYFKEKTGFDIVINNSGKVGFPQSGILSAPEYGILQITKAEDGTYSATFDDSIKDKLTIKYIDVKKANEYIANSQQEFGFENAFDQYKELNDMFNSIEVRLSRLDDAQWGNYADFMDYASSMIDGVLDENDYDKAFDKLKDMLSKLGPSDLNDTNLNALKQKIDEGGLSNIEKTLIVDRFKMLFSYHISLTDGQKDGANLVSAINGRGNVYERLTGYNGEAFPLAGQNYREKILNQLKDKTNLSREAWPSLIGMTAFYRYNKNGKRITEGRGYSMTEMGKTTVLGGAYEELTDDASRNRFISNLKKSEAHKAILSEAITRKVQSVSGLEETTINSDQVITLLEGKELDISGKKFKIEMKYIFYLLGECGNESIGANLEKIIIKGAGGGGGGETGTTTVEIGPETSYRDAAGLSIDGVAAESRLNIGTSRSQTYGVAVGSVTPKEGEGAVTHQEGGTPGQESGTTGQEGGGGSGSGGGGSGGGNGGGSGGGSGGGNNGSGGGGSNGGNGGGGRP